MEFTDVKSSALRFPVAKYSLTILGESLSMERKMKNFLITLLALSFCSLTFSQETTCDILNTDMSVSIDERQTPITLKTIFSNGMYFTEEVIQTYPTQTTVIVNGQPVFIDALLYITSFGTQAGLYEVNGRIEGFISGGFSQAQVTPLINCVEAP